MDKTVRFYQILYQHPIAIYIVIGTAYVAAVRTAVANDQCDLNDDACFSLADKSNWKFNYVTTKQEYIDLISQGKSGITNQYREKDGLARRNGVRTGHVDKLTFEDGRTVDVITGAMRPLLFKIPDFLTAEECDYIIKQAQDPKQGGMYSSKLHDKHNDTFKPTGAKGKALGKFGDFSAWDKNNDGFIGVDEIIVFVHASQIPLILLEEDVHEMFKTLDMHQYLRDGLIDNNEFNKLNTLGMEEYLNIIAREHHRFKHRNSEQAWLSMDQSKDQTLNRIRERLVKITGLGREIIYGGELLQVVHYDKYGHYHAHFDTEFGDNACCHLRSLWDTTRCRLCRYITFMIYLNDVEEGGETAFPMADEGPIDEDGIWDILRGNSSTDKINLSHGCQRSNLVIRPRKGMGVLWYNHLLDERDGWMGEKDVYSFHGGCDVVKGEKWVSNMWITAPNGHSKELPSSYLNWKDLYLAQIQARG